jgi:tyrosinase
MTDIAPNPQTDGLGYNPRCLRRDINKKAAVWTTTERIYELITENKNMHWFQTVMEGQFPEGKYGVHAGGHFTISGDPGGDFYVSPADPAFYVHHTQLDRLWWIWQIQDLEKRLLDLAKTRTMRNSPPSEPGTLDDLTNMGVLGGDVPVRDLMNTMGGMGGKLCYIYE